ncbi:MAG: alpha/beta hydrolase fold domain-containing protein [Prevotella sp.]|nr:alpha/beta hydrolase fold domain-containing protein [Prevotella sp.]
MLLALLALTMQAQTARKFTVNITADGKANMVAYLPASPTGRAIVDCPGGGYNHLSMQNEGHDWAEYFNRQGIAFFVLTYRMPQGDRTIPMSDAQQAIRTVRDSAAVWGINPRDVGIMGFSAGGHLASTVSTHSEFDCRPDFSILFYPVISMNERESHKGSCQNFLGPEGQKDAKLVKEFSNQNAVRRHLTPPAIILAANDDGAVPPVTNAIAYYSAMRRAGNDCALYVYPSGGHGFGFRSTWAFHDQMLSDLTIWLNAHKSPRQDAVRVACIGNSITDGSGIDMCDTKGYPAQLQRLLGSGYLVKNYGVSARTMLDKGDHPYKKEQAWRDAVAFRPDVVIIKLGTNDSKPENWQYGQEFEQDLMAMIDQLCPMVPVLNKKGKPTKKMVRSQQTKIYLCTPIPAFKPTWNINDSVIVNGIIPIINKVAAREGLNVIDLHSLFKDEDGKQMQSDGIHPTDKGAAQMARIIGERVKIEN